MQSYSSPPPPPPRQLVQLQSPPSTAKDAFDSFSLPSKAFNAQTPTDTPLLERDDATVDDEESSYSEESQNTERDEVDASFSTGSEQVSTSPSSPSASYSTSPLSASDSSPSVSNSFSSSASVHQPVPSGQLREWGLAAPLHFAATPARSDPSELTDGHGTLQARNGVNEARIGGSNALAVAEVVAHTRKSRIERKKHRELRARQSRILLATLLENFTFLYDQSPEHNKKLFHLLCGRLTLMGLLEKEHLDEMNGLRRTYDRAFRELVGQAWTATREGYQIMESRLLQSSMPDRMSDDISPPSSGNLPLESEILTNGANDTNTSDELGSEFSGSNHRPNVLPQAQTVSTVSRFQPSPFPLLLSSAMVNNDLPNQPHQEITAPPEALPLNSDFHSTPFLFDVTDSRYVSDFEELRELGKGGFGSVVVARNRLDGAVYAVKKIRVGQFGDDEYDKLFREIKSLARLEHVNIVRYYSSWIEHIAVPPSKSENPPYPDQAKFVQRVSEWAASFSYNGKDSTKEETVESSQRKGSQSSFPMENTGDESKASADRDSKSEISQRNVDPYQIGHIRDETNEKHFATPNMSNVIASQLLPPHDRTELKGRVHNLDTRTESTLSASEIFREEVISDRKLITTGPQEPLYIPSTTKSFGQYHKSSYRSDFTQTPQSWNTNPSSGSVPDAFSSSFRSKDEVTQYGPFIQPPVTDLVLFIQMQLYQANLREWLQTRNRRIFACIRTMKTEWEKNGTGFSQSKAAMRCGCVPSNPHLAKNSRNPLAHVSRHTILEIFRGLVDGVAHLHAKGHIHRDLKPANVFLERVENGEHCVCREKGVKNDKSWTTERFNEDNVAWIPKIGDFGLSTTANVFQSKPKGCTPGMSPSPFVKSRELHPSGLPWTTSQADFSTKQPDAGDYGNVDQSERTKGIGTVIYASPEMVNGQGTYDDKVDMYALGIILFELLHPFETRMERAQMLESLRIGHEVPTNMRNHWPEESLLIRRLISVDPEMRPSAKETAQICYRWLRARENNYDDAGSDRISSILIQAKENAGRDVSGCVCQCHSGDIKRDPNGQQDGDIVKSLREQLEQCRRELEERENECNKLKRQIRILELEQLQSIYP